MHYTALSAVDKTQFNNSVGTTIFYLKRQQNFNFKFKKCTTSGIIDETKKKISKKSIRKG